MHVFIHVVQPIPNHLDEWDEWVDSFEILGAKADDYDPETKVVTLEVNADDINADYELSGGMVPHEICGAIQMIQEIEITVRECLWNNMAIINAEDVCAQLENLTCEI